MNKSEMSYEELVLEIYQGIDRAHPNLGADLREKYARIALYMIKKNKTEMAIHAPKKSIVRWQKALLELKRQQEEQPQNNIIEIEDIKRKLK